MPLPSIFTRAFFSSYFLPTLAKESFKAWSGRPSFALTPPPTLSGKQRVLVFVCVKFLGTFGRQDGGRDGPSPHERYGHRQEGKQEQAWRWVVIWSLVARAISIGLLRLRRPTQSFAFFVAREFFCVHSKGSRGQVSYTPPLSPPHAWWHHPHFLPIRDAPSFPLFRRYSRRAGLWVSGKA